MAARLHLLPLLRHGVLHRFLRILCLRRLLLHGNARSCPDADACRKIVRIVNPAETQSTLSFAINGRAYSLEAGKTQELELTANMVIEFDHGTENKTGRYVLSDGTYHFVPTPQGWDLHDANAIPVAPAAGK